MDEGDSVVGITYGSKTIRIGVEGRFSAVAAGRFREALELALERQPRKIRIDGSQVGSLSAAGITALADAVVLARDAGVDVRVQLSSEAQQVLDEVGLWWLAVPEAPVQSVGPAVKKALRSYAQIVEQRASPAAEGGVA